MSICAPRWHISKLVFADKIVDVLHQTLAVHAVNHTGLLNALAARCGTAEAVHPHTEEELCCFGMVVQYLTDEGILCNFQPLFIPFLWFDEMLYRTLDKRLFRVISIIMFRNKQCNIQSLYIRQCLVNNI